ncbi:MAG TPA: hypothetical protein VE987_05090, partial [Polyangiaceae bacterium]|nr:hypothetical protein [Polyangiaceae bacterium]
LSATIATILNATSVQIQIPPSVWATTATFAVTATQNGWTPPSTFVTAPTLSLYGLTLPAGTDPATYAWPATSWTFPQNSVNGPLVATPLNGTVNGVKYTYPPVDGLATAKADQVDIVSRTQIALSGAWTSCTEQAGTASVTLFDNHVVGCHVAGGSTCTTGSTGSQAGFLDSNRTIYTVGSATFVAKIVANTATCSDVLTALP